MEYDLKALSFGQIIGKGINIYLDNFISIFTISLFGNFIPYILVLAVNSGVSATGVYSTSAAFLSTAITIIASVLATALIIGFTIELVASRYLQKRIDFRQTIKSVLPLVLPVLGVSVLTALAVFGGALLFIVPLSFLGSLAFVGIIAGFIAAIIIYLRFSVASQVLVVERKKVIESLKRSVFLTKGYKWQLFGLFIIVNIMVYIIQIVAMLIFGAILLPLLQSELLLGIIEFIVQAATAPVMACVLGLAYFNTRISLEGFAMEHLVEYFTMDDVEGESDRI